ncbi:crotonobetainyl-CoA:carnitine CoA-transferase CaiB-like acyl-CoA transferase [Antricoccus suffuscus]|uniref:Crotonobetainyl-CoA:carnitine CoA-transferase CaiB-like acyl-CoA transferase n=1 Tax=Antricoccus suffuscus TaxID=1629062 RepID=A0A2T0ZUH1_9ACTN|nr:CoA transferase [Antricoccus suffuscus]PRZ39728.1 crotonobetainyl-CoA:carnitine CoA-transferase CaiB-like acyl-CoA transferase [Antricoccus suffuscus]
MGSAPLDGLAVLDISNSIAGQYCGRLLADAGADVVLVEPPSGTPVRRMGPFWRDGSRPDDSILFWHINSSKRSLTLDWTTPTGADLLKDVASSAQVVVTSAESADVESLLPGNDSRFLCRVEEFAADASYQSWRGSELIHQAMSGTMFENGAAEREPLFGVGHRAYYAAGTVAYISIVAQLLATEPTASSARISVAETAPSMNYNRVTQHWYSGGVDPRGDPHTPRMTLRCKDGWIVAFPTPRRWLETCRVFRAPEVADDPRFSNDVDRHQAWRSIEAIFQAGVENVPRDEIVADALRVRVVAAKVASPDDLWTDPHLRHRHYWQELDDNGISRPMLGPLYRFTPHASRNISRPPRLGDSTKEILEGVGISIDELELLRNIGVA